MSRGVGITAHSEGDAIVLFRLAWPTSYKIVAIEPIEDMQTIDQEHVAPNMENWLKRGIWYPRGYAHFSD
jgi:hypothetical protein